MGLEEQRLLVGLAPLLCWMLMGLRKPVCAVLHQCVMTW